jgi:YbbR domain-containing protein
MSFLRRVTSEIATFLLALLLAVFVWTAAVRATDPTMTKSLELAIEQRGLLPAEGEVTLTERTIRLTVEGPTSLVRPLTTDDFTAYVDLSLISFGESEVPITVEYNAPRVEIVFQEPRTSTAVAEAIIDKEIPLIVQVRGDVARGHTMGEPVSDPSSILISGPASRVNQIVEAQINIFLDGPREDFVQVRRPIFQNADGRVASISGLSLSTEEVLITVPVLELEGVAEKPIIVQWSGSPAVGYRLLNVTVEPNSQLVSGAPATLAAVRSIRTEPVDISGLDESFTTPASLILPNGIQLEEVQPVVVTFEIEPIFSTAVIRRIPDLRALGRGLEAEIEPEQLTVTLFGPLSILDSIIEEDVSITLDLLNLVTGTHTIAPIVTIFANDVEVRSFQPELIVVRIRAIPPDPDPEAGKEDEATRPLRMGTGWVRPFSAFIWPSPTSVSNYPPPRYNRL